MSMNELNLNDLMIETVSCLTQTFTSVDKKVREEAEMRLRELEKNLLIHFKVILEAVKGETILTKEQRISVILYMKRLVKERIKEKFLNAENAIEIIKIYIDIILTNTLSDICILNLTNSLHDLLNYSLVASNKQIVNEMVDLLANFLQNSVGGNIPVYRSIIPLIECIFQSSSVGIQNVIVVLNKMLEMTEYMLNSILLSFKNIDIVNDLKTFLSYVEICTKIFNFLCISVQKLRSRLNNTIKKVADLFNEKFAQIASTLIMMTIPNILEPYFIAFKCDSEFDNIINSMKAKVLQYQNSILMSTKIDKDKDYLIKINSALMQSIMQNLDYVVVDKLSYIQKMSKDSQEFPDYNYQNLIYQMILYVVRNIDEKSPSKESFREYAKNFAKAILIPLLIVSQTELSTMKEDGEEYSNYITDVIDERKSKTIKAVSSTLLDSMCEEYDGFTTFIVNYCVQLVDFGIKGADLNIISDYNLLSADDRIFKIAGVEYQIETCFLVFCIVAGPLLKNNNLVGTLKNLLVTHFEALVSANSDIIKNRMCLFLGIFLDNIFGVEDRQFALSLEYLFINLFYYKQNQAVSHQAADSLNDIVGVKKFRTVIKNVLDKYIMQFVENVKDIKIGLYFDVMLEIVLNLDIDEYVISLMKELVTRVIKEIAPYTRIKFTVTNEDGTKSSSRREKDPQYNLIVNKCFNIIRTIADKAQYVSKYIFQFEEIMEPVFDHMRNPSKIDFDEDIVMIMTSFIKHLKTIPKTGLKILPDLPKYLKKSKCLQLDLYELMNLYAVYGKGVIDTKEEYSKVMMKIFRASFDKQSENDKSAFLGASLMQIWLENSDQIPENLVREMLLISIDQIKSISNLYTEKSEFLESNDLFTFNALLVVIYSGFINYCNITFEAIITNNDINAFINWTEELISIKYYNLYLSKLIIIGMCSFLRNANLIKQIPEYTNKFLKFSLELLNKQKNEESKSLKSALKKEIHCNFIDSDEEDMNSENEDDGLQHKLQNINKMLSKDMEKLYDKFDIDEYSGYSNEMEIKNICDRTINPVKDVDEYEFFKKSVEHLNAFDQSIMAEWANKLSDKERINLNNLIHTRRVNISHDKITANVPRKLVRIINRRSNEGANESNN